MRLRVNTMSSLIQTKNIGRKFNPDGSVRFFPGNTIISKVKPENSIYPVITKISDAFREADTARKYTFLPFSSLHMTMIQGVCDEDRKETLWSRYLPLDLPLSQVDDFFEEKYKAVEALPETHMVFDTIDISGATILVRFKPETAKDAEKLKRFRDDVSEKLGVRFPDHDSYGFHISVAYLLWELDEKERAAIEETCRKLEEPLKAQRPVFTLRQPDMTYFKDMMYFSGERIAR